MSWIGWSVFWFALTVPTVLMGAWVGVGLYDRWLAAQLARRSQALSRRPTVAPAAQPHPEPVAAVPDPDASETFRKVDGWLRLPD